VLGAGVHEGLANPLYHVIQSIWVPIRVVTKACVRPSKRGESFAQGSPRAGSALYIAGNPSLMQAESPVLVTSPMADAPAHSQPLGSPRSCGCGHSTSRTTHGSRPKKC
jgi:hypothetical protein